MLRRTHSPTVSTPAFSRLLLIVLLLTFDSPTIISGRGVGLLVNAESDPDL